MVGALFEKSGDIATDLVKIQASVCASMILSGSPLPQILPQEVVMDV